MYEIEVKYSEKEIEILRDVAAQFGLEEKMGRPSRYKFPAPVAARIAVHLVTMLNLSTVNKAQVMESLKPVAQNKPTMEA